MNRLILGAVMATALCGPAAAQAQMTAGVICNPKSQITNARSGPTAKGTEVVDAIANNTAVKILDRVKNPEGTHEWLKVEFKHSKSGAMSTAYVYHEGVSATCGVQAAIAAPVAVPTVSAPPVPSLPKFDPELEFIFRGHSAHVSSVSFSRDGSKIVSASNDNTARVWDARSGNHLATLAGHSEGVYSAMFSPDGGTIVTASYDKTARLWDARTSNAIATLTGHSHYVMSALFSPDGATVVTASQDKTARLWDARTGKSLFTLQGHDNILLSAVFSTDGSRIVTSSADKTARIWDAKTGAFVASLTGHTNWIRSASFSPDGSKIVTASDDHTARLWDAHMGKELATLTGHNNGVSTAVFSPDGSQILTSSEDATARVWDARAGTVIAKLSAHTKAIPTAHFSADGNRILTASFDTRAHLWDARTGNDLGRIPGLDSRNLWSASFSPDGSKVANSSMDFAVRLWVWNPTPEERARIKDVGQQARIIYKKQLLERTAAATALDCDKVKAIDEMIGPDGQLEPCQYEKLQRTAPVREVFLAAGKFDMAKERDKAKTLYNAILKRFPNDDLAIEATKRLTAINDVESIELAKAATEKAVKDAEAARAAQAAQAAQQQAPQRSTACDHVYVGKEFKVPGAVLGILPAWYRVAGFSAESQRVTVKDTQDGRTAEVGCHLIPR